MSNGVTFQPLNERVHDVRLDAHKLHVELVDGRTISVPLNRYPRLLAAMPEHREKWEKCAGGFGIHWPDLDEDLSIEDILYGSQSRLYSSDRKWSRAVLDVMKRESAVLSVAGFLSRRNITASKEISSTDIFVEKAHHTLENRAWWMRSLAVLAMFIAVLLVYFGYEYYIDHLTLFAFDLKPGLPNTEILIAGLVRNATFFGIFFGLEYLLVSLFRAFIHEAVILDNRIHSLRLGRLYIYLKYASVRNPEEMQAVRHSITASDLEKVFGWNIETSTAFKDIDASTVTKSIWSNISDAITSIASKKEK